MIFFEVATQVNFKGVFCDPNMLKTSTKVTWHNFDDLVRQ